MKLLVVIIIVFLLGLIYTVKYGDGGCCAGNGGNKREGFLNQPKCPNLLIQKGNQFLLYNTNVAEVPGVNPIAFANLNDYVEFMEWQRSNGIRCPILFLKYSYDAQGNPVYSMRPSPEDPQGGLPPMVPLGEAVPPMTLLVDAARNNFPFNENSYPGFDQNNQYIGDYTPLDKLAHAQEKVRRYSTSAMDTNWGGAVFSQAAVDAGNYSSDQVAIDDTTNNI